MNGLGGLNKSPNGVLIGLVQLQLPTVKTPADLAAQTTKIVATVAKARANMGTMDLVVFPEYALHGLSMDTNPAIMCRMDGPEVAVAGGAQDCPYTYMTDLAAGRYRLPWEAEVVHTDGTGFGFPEPTPRFGETMRKAAE